MQLHMYIHAHPASVIACKSEQGQIQHEANKSASVISTLLLYSISKAIAILTSV